MVWILGRWYSGMLELLIALMPKIDCLLLFKIVKGILTIGFSHLHVMSQLDPFMNHLLWVHLGYFLLLLLDTWCACCISLLLHLELALLILSHFIHAMFAKLSCFNDQVFTREVYVDVWCTFFRLMFHLSLLFCHLQVPNTIEFADWIGRTKQKQIRVTG